MAIAGILNVKFLQQLADMEGGVASRLLVEADSETLPRTIRISEVSALQLRSTYSLRREHLVEQGIDALCMDQFIDALDDLGADMAYIFEILVPDWAS